MGEIVHYRPPRARAEWTAYLGMVIFLASWAMMFGSLFFAYGMVRARAVTWPPPDLPRLPRLLPGINTAILAASSGALHATVLAIRRARPGWVGPGIALTAVLGAVFLGLQMTTWRSLYDDGLTPSDGAYPSVFYGLTCFHGVHVLVGIVALAWLSRNGFLGKYTAARYLPVRLWALYWHFVGVVWLAMFVSIYLF